MGAQQVLRAVACSALIATSASAAPGREPAAVIDLGPPDPEVRRTLAAALVHAGLQPLDEATEDALAGHAGDRDGLELAATMAEAQRRFGALDCPGAIAAARRALSLVAARQAAGLAVPELPRAWAYELLCADRTGDSDTAMRAAARLRAIGGSPDITADLLAKYPDVDLTLGVTPVEVDVTTEIPDTMIWLDFAPIGKSPQHLALAPGEHVLAAASGTRRGFLIGKPIKKQPTLLVEMPDQSGPRGGVAAEVASWKGAMPSAAAIGEVLEQVHVRAALIRHGNIVEVWGRAGLAEPAHRLGGEDGTRTLADADRAALLLADRIEGWSSHAPDPDRPLLVETLEQRAARVRRGTEPTAWWVYATIGAAILAGTVVIYAHQQDSNTQEIKLHYP